jgi:hypothetical protein
MSTRYHGGAQEIVGAGKARPHRLCAEVFEFCTGDAQKPVIPSSNRRDPEAEIRKL